MAATRPKRHRTSGAGLGEERPSDLSSEPPAPPLLVVGVGASAGGWEPIRRLFSAMPTGHGIAFVLVQHLDPSHENLTVRLLASVTALAVVEATEGMALLADRIHVIPPAKFLNIADRVLGLQEPAECQGLRMPIDHFFCSLAADQGHRACGVVLSGAGSDGTLGLSEIRASGGTTVAEDPSAAEFPPMPRSAIDAGVADAVLPAEAMPEAILAVAKRLGPTPLAADDAGLHAVLDVVRAVVGHDFRCYKPNTLVRRIRRRMSLARVATFARYAEFLRDHPDEARALQKDFLIGVTDFFRQPEAWQTLEDTVARSLIENAEPGSVVRAWVPGCSTGKEAYSLAMLLGEQVERSGKKVGIQLFATDTDAGALEVARAGSYTEEEIGESVSAERLKRFFTHAAGRYQIRKKVREQIVFAPQNLMADPPFSKLDLVSCRNLLIYVDAQVQKKIIALFHFALREGGSLFLGSAETVGGREELFEPISKKWRIYRRIGVGRQAGLEIPLTIGRPAGEGASAADRPPLASPARRMSLPSVAHQVLLERFAPASVLVDRKGELLYSHGAVEDYLAVPAGESTHDVTVMAREGLRTRLRGALVKAAHSAKPVSVAARVLRGERSFPVRLSITPLRHPREANGLLLVAFEEIRTAAPVAHETGAAGADVRELEDELKVTKEELQSTIEQLENSNDQLKASNEEVTAANEELQSTNEELETSKEELQSLNEELNTVNIRLQEKVDELESAGNDVVNLLASTSIATVFLDREFKVRRYTPAITRLLSLIPSDLGRPFADISRRFTDEALVSDARQVLTDLTPVSKEVWAEDGRWYIRRVTPYRTQDDRIEGVVVTFVDVSDLKTAQEEAARLASFPLLNPQPIVEADLAGRICFVNPAAERLFPDLRDRGPEHPWLRDWEAVARACAEGRTELAARDVAAVGSWYEQVMYYVPETRRVRLYARDITKRKRAEETLRESERRERERAEELAALLEAVPTPVIIVHDSDATHMTGNRAADQLLRHPRGAEASLSAPPEVKPRHFRAIKGARELSLDELPAQRAARGEHVQDFDFSLVFDDGTIRHLLGYGTPLLDEQGRPRGAVHVLVDITERQEAEEQIRRHVEELRVINADLERFNTASTGRELRMIELKKEVNELCLRIGQPPRYPLDFNGEPP